MVICFQIDIAKVELTIINKWITERLIDLLGFEDDIVINLVINMLTESVSRPTTCMFLTEHFYA